MLDVLKFIFSNFWVWLGTVLLTCGVIGTVGEATSEIIKATKSPNNGVILKLQEDKKDE